mgnify:FL=1
MSMVSLNWICNKINHILKTDFLTEDLFFNFSGKNKHYFQAVQKYDDFSLQRYIFKQKH